MESAAWVAESPITLPEADDCWDVSEQLLSQILTHDDLTFLLRSAEIPYSMGALLTFIAHVLMLPRSWDQWGSDLRGISHFFITAIMFLWINRSFFFFFIKEGSNRGFISIGLPHQRIVPRAMEYSGV